VLIVNVIVGSKIEEVEVAVTKLEANEYDYDE
jgi:hypothetical protein